MVEESVQLVQGRVQVDRGARVPHGIAGRVLQDALVASSFEPAPGHRVVVSCDFKKIFSSIPLYSSTGRTGTCGAVVDDDVVGSVSGRVPSSCDHQVDGIFDGNYVADKLSVEAECTQKSLAHSGDESGRTVQVVDPSGHGLFVGRSDDRRPHNGQRNGSAFLLQQIFRQTFGVRVRIGHLSNQPKFPCGRERKISPVNTKAWRESLLLNRLFGDVLNHFLIHPVGAVNQPLRMNGRRVNFLVNLIFVAVGVRCRHVDESLRFIHHKNESLDLGIF